MNKTDEAENDDDVEESKEQTELSDFTIGQELITYVTGVYNFCFYYYSKNGVHLYIKSIKNEPLFISFG